MRLETAIKWWRWLLLLKNITLSCNLLFYFSALLTPFFVVAERFHIYCSCAQHRLRISFLHCIYLDESYSKINGPKNYRNFECWCSLCSTIIASNLFLEETQCKFKNSFCPTWLGVNGLFGSSFSQIKLNANLLSIAKIPRDLQSKKFLSCRSQ